MSRDIAALSDRFRPLATQFLFLLNQAHIPVIVVQTTRTQEEALANLKKGVSWTHHSKHVTGDALDVVIMLKGPDGVARCDWKATSPLWPRLGLIAEGLGLRWGGRWQQRDWGHVEYVEHPVNPVVA